MCSCSLAVGIHGVSSWGFAGEARPTMFGAMSTRSTWRFIFARIAESFDSQALSGLVTGVRSSIQPRPSGSSRNPTGFGIVIVSELSCLRDTSLSPRRCHVLPQCSSVPQYKSMSCGTAVERSR